MGGETVAPLIVQSISAWSNSLSTLGIAINGGIAALCLQILVHNHENKTSPLRLRAIVSLLACFILEGVNIFFGFLVQGSLIAGIPTLLGATYEIGQPIQQNKIIPLDAVQYLGKLQFFTFGAGVLALIFLIPFNWNKLKGSS